MIESKGGMQKGGVRWRGKLCIQEREKFKGEFLSRDRDCVCMRKRVLVKLSMKPVSVMCYNYNITSV